MPGAELTIAYLTLDRWRQLEKTQGVGNRSPRPTYSMSYFLMSEVELFDQLLISTRCKFSTSASSRLIASSA
jgi:hypothetical protein